MVVVVLVIHLYLLYRTCNNSNNQVVMVGYWRSIMENYVHCLGMTVTFNINCSCTVTKSL